MRVLNVPRSSLLRAPKRTPHGRRRSRPEARFEAFYETNYAPVVRLAYSLCGSLSVAEELAQEAFLVAHDRWRRIRDFDRPDLWVRRVVINRSISHRRRISAERRAIERVGRRRNDHPALAPAEREVWEALQHLSPRQADVLALVYVEDRPISDVAIILGVGEETVRTHLKRGRQAMAVLLGTTTVEVES